MSIRGNSPKQIQYPNRAKPQMMILQLQSISFTPQPHGQCVYSICSPQRCIMDSFHDNFSMVPSFPLLRTIIVIMEICTIIVAQIYFQSNQRFLRILYVSNYQNTSQHLASNLGTNKNLQCHKQSFVTRRLSIIMQKKESPMLRFDIE